MSFYRNVEYYKCSTKSENAVYISIVVNVTTIIKDVYIFFIYKYSIHPKIEPCVTPLVTALQSLLTSPNVHMKSYHC